MLIFLPHNSVTGSSTNTTEGVEGTQSPAKAWGRASKPGTKRECLQSLQSLSVPWDRRWPELPLLPAELHKQDVVILQKPLFVFLNPHRVLQGDHRS